MQRKIMLMVPLLLVGVFMMSNIRQSAGQEQIFAGQTLQGELTTLITQATYFYTAVANEQITIEVAALTAGLQPQFTVVNQGGVLIQSAENLTGAAVTSNGVVFPADGTYRILVGSANSTTGQYTITVTPGQADAATPDPQVPGVATATTVPLQPTITPRYSCGELVDVAMTITDQSCEGMGSDEACYGNVILQAEPRSQAQDFQFSVPGDVVEIADLAGLRLSSMQIRDAVWGIAKMRVQANMPDELQSVEIVLFGNVQIENQGGDDFDGPQVIVAANEDANIRQLPRSDSPAFVVLGPGAQATANGRTENGWIRVLYLDATGEQQVGWIRDSQITAVNGDLNTLELAAPDAIANEYGPMQAFTLETGVDDAPCQEAPDSGILIQTPQGVGEITLLINEVVIDLGSTAYVQATAGQDMNVFLLEGQGEVTAQNVAVPVLPGTVVNVAIGDDGLPTSPPSLPQPYDQTKVLPLPVQLLPEAIAIAPPLPQEEINQIFGIVTPVPPTPVPPTAVPAPVISPTPPLPQLPTTGPCVLATRDYTSVNARQGPAIAYTVLAFLNPQSIYNVSGRIDDNSWYQLNINNTLVWVAQAVTRLGGDCQNVPLADYPPPPGSVIDTDGDGIPDDEDACPDEFSDTTTDGCPVSDIDGDGVEDSLDQCPDVFGDINNNGCPLDPDGDGDGVPDSQDACVSTFGDADNFGCPIATEFTGTYIELSGFGPTSGSATGNVSSPAGESADQIEFGVYELLSSGYDGLSISTSCSGENTSEVSFVIESSAGGSMTLTCGQTHIANLVRVDSASGDVNIINNSQTGSYVDWAVSFQLLFSK